MAVPFALTQNTILTYAGVLAALCCTASCASLLSAYQVSVTWCCLTCSCGHTLQEHHSLHLRVSISEKAIIKQFAGNASLYWPVAGMLDMPSVPLPLWAATKATNAHMDRCGMNKRQIIGPALC